LNNDYYLDLKTEAINRYIETIFTDHVNNADIHFSWSNVQYLISTSIVATGLTQNTLVVLPLYKSRGKNTTINNILKRIREIPHNLNRIYIMFYVLYTGI
jgi:hypothetical protein